MSRNRNSNKGGKARPRSKAKSNTPDKQKDIRKNISRGKNKVSQKRIELVGIVSMAREGYAFVISEDVERDVFVRANKLRGALNGDKVRVSVRVPEGVTLENMDSIKGKKLEGEVVDLIERSNRPHIGVLQIIRGEAWVMMESRVMPWDIKIPIEEVREIPNGVKVAVRVVSWPRKSAAPIGTILDVLGKPGENDTEMHAILAEFGLPYKFEDDVIAAADKISEKITEKEISKRRDFRDITTFTIDPSDAKDFDDALSLKRLDNGNWEVGVHIADVTHYVRPDTILEAVAQERATSVYLVDRTVPMLPEKLSNKLCSLRPNEEKLCFSAVFEMNEKAKVINRWFGRTIIKSDYRFDYDAAQDIIEGISDGPYKEEMMKLHHLAGILRQARFDAGAISFERPEMKVYVDETGKPIDVIQKITKDSNWLIEEFMLLANRNVADFVGKMSRKPTFVYRIHDKPNAEKLEALNKFVTVFGYKFNPGDGAGNGDVADSLNSLFEQSKGTPEESAIEIMALRSMAKAKYSTDNVGHYGLAFDYYTHFTSPIRRYPDMMVHRLLAIYLDNGKSQDKPYYEGRCKYSSEREQVATDAERASIKYKMVEFMQDKVGQEFVGHISGLTEWGMYVEIEPTKIEGMIHLSSIKEDYYIFNEETFTLIGKGKGKKYTLGSEVRIKVTRANLEQKLLDFELLPEDEIILK